MPCLTVGQTFPSVGLRRPDDLSLSVAGRAFPVLRGAVVHLTEVLMGRRHGRPHNTTTRLEVLDEVQDVLILRLSIAGPFNPSQGFTSARLITRSAQTCPCRLCAFLRVCGMVVASCVIQETERTDASDADVRRKGEVSPVGPLVHKVDEVDVPVGTVDG